MCLSVLIHIHNRARRSSADVLGSPPGSSADLIAVSACISWVHRYLSEAILDVCLFIIIASLAWGRERVALPVGWFVATFREVVQEVAGDAAGSWFCASVQWLRVSVHGDIQADCLVLILDSWLILLIYTGRSINFHGFDGLLEHIRGLS